MNIILPPSFTETHKSVIIRYLTNYQTLSSAEWLVALEGFDILGKAVAIVQGNRTKLKELYTQFIDRQYADGFLENLFLSIQPEQDGMQLKVAIAKQIFEDLSSLGFYVQKELDSQFVLAYCFYWWDAFAKGYIFEAMIFKDLKDFGIEFIPHDFRDREQRFSRSDLILSGFRGDIKTSSYFLHFPRTNMRTFSFLLIKLFFSFRKRKEKFGLTNDFYITRLFASDKRQWIEVVLMQEKLFVLINGDTIECELKNCYQVLPSPARVKLFQCDLIALPYQEWKQRIKMQQERGILNA
jgi:hypothetical protein